MSVDLNTCQPGQKVRFRNGTIGTYQQYDKYTVTEYKHDLFDAAGEQLSGHTDDGYLLMSSFQHALDVVEILPLTFTPEAVAPFCAAIAASPSTPEAEELIRVYDATFGSTAPGCCPEALAAVLVRIAESDPSSRDLHRLAAALRGG